MATERPVDAEPEYISIPRGAREILDCGPRIVRRAVADGEIAVYLIGHRQRVRRDELRRWALSRRVRATRHAEARVAEILEREGRAG